MTHKNLEADEIRLLELLPNKSLSGHLHHFSLSNHPQYEALSYMWGDPADQEVINLGIDFPISRNLYNALASLVAPSSRFLWVDAICINQDDIDERNEQVKMMQEIYREAGSVIAWIDHELDTPTLALLQILADVSDPYTYNLGNDAKVWEPVIKLLEEPYWFRVWIQQELVVAREVQIHCRDKIIPLAAIENFQLSSQLRTLGLNGEWADGWYQLFARCKIGLTPSTILTEWRQKWPNRGVGLPIQHGDPNNAFHRGSILHCLSAFRSLQASDQRDRVYALVGIALDTKTHDIDIDYRSSLAECFSKVARFVINRYGSLDFLCQVHLLQETLETELPSWVPDWHSTKIHPEIFSNENRASGDIKCHARIESGCLKARGFRVDGLHFDHGDWPAKQGTIEVAFTLIQLSKIANELRKDVSPEETVCDEVIIPDQLLRTITARFEGNNWEKGTAEDLRAGAQALFNIARSLMETLPQFGETDFPLVAIKQTRIMEVLEPAVRSVVFSIIWSLAEKSLLVTTSGRLGLYLHSPLSLDDEIWVLFGCTMPVLLRKQDNHYIHVGPVHIDGYMTGEVVEGISEDSYGDVGEYIIRDIEIW